MWAVWDNSEPDREDSAAEVQEKHLELQQIAFAFKVDDTEDESDESGEESDDDIVEEEEEDLEENLDEEMEEI